MTASKWCASTTPYRIETYWTDPVSGAEHRETNDMTGHEYCLTFRWHDEWHGTRCCGGPEERESWACSCDCHREKEGRLF